ncbi:GTD-binding domain-containing protein [Heracleum sosnowskyi]|uniref:GTD-binding domain-containing protein n=1 Tax=Heracleum sosnowskyi TaxID=360622 RepID=A0AAD8JIA0_9APIA|nr:GTD-binding domain-containing protein [Heracleum sosnowskyi]
MAPNQFATMLHRRANKMSTILVYALLEWVLIVLLLLNCLFYYVIRKFAICFGLKPPCLLCSRVEHLLEPHNNTNTYENFMCEAHATEISSLNYCPSHHKLTEFNNLCKNCIAFQHLRSGKVIKSSPKVAVYESLGRDVAKNDDGNQKCSCCDEVLSSGLLLKPSWDILEHAQKTSFIAEVLQDKEAKNKEWNISKYDMQEHCSEGSQVDDTIENIIYKYVNAKSFDNATTTTMQKRNGDEESLEVVNWFSQVSESSDLDQLILAEVFHDPTVRSQRSGIHSKGNVVGILDDLQGDNDVDNPTDQSPGPEELKKWQVEEAECWDGSVMSEQEVDVGDSANERLKSLLEAEHNALRALQAELEEERNAAAIAANQTMAMITRVQEEKSAMQMEALHYQRMMEEQSEYDQEALQILNDLVIKREKEKLELEKDLEVYRKKVLDYEAKEKMMMMTISKSVRSITLSASSSSTDDDDELFIDLIHEDTVDDHRDKYNSGELVSEIEENGRECMKHLSILDESIAQFEDERVSILEELKSLEGKLFTLADNDEETCEDRTLKNQGRDVYNEEVDESYKFNINEYNGQGFIEKDQLMNCTAKRLLPLFDATNSESEGEVNEEDADYECGGNEISLVNDHKMEMEFSIEEEVDHVYRRLQALEADKEFLKHCFGCLKKGEKGRELLEEILERLCEFRTVEIQVRNRGD